jgi:hypothetical protein
MAKTYSNLRPVLVLAVHQELEEAVRKCMVMTETKHPIIVTRSIDDYRGQLEDPDVDGSPQFVLIDSSVAREAAQAAKGLNKTRLLPLVTVACESLPDQDVRELYESGIASVVFLSSPSGDCDKGLAEAIGFWTRHVIPPPATG